LEEFSKSNNIQLECSECKELKPYKQIFLLKCGCKYCPTCIRKIIFSFYSKSGFKNLCDSNEKEKIMNSVICVKHKSIIPYNVIAKCLNFKELEIMEFRSLNRMKNQLSEKKIYIDQILAKYCCGCNKVTDPENGNNICKRNHFMCKKCIENIYILKKYNKSEKCPFPDCPNNIILNLKHSKIREIYNSNI